MKRSRLTRRELVETCIVRGLLVAGIPMSAANLMALWEKTEGQSLQPTPIEVLGPFFKKGAPDSRTLRQPGDAGVPLHVSGKVRNTRGEPAIAGKRHGRDHFGVARQLAHQVPAPRIPQESAGVNRSVWPRLMRMASPASIVLFPVQF